MKEKNLNYIPRGFYGHAFEIESIILPIYVGYNS